MNSFMLIGSALLLVIAATFVAADPTAPGHRELVECWPDRWVRPCGFNHGRCTQHWVVCPQRLPWN